MADLTGRSQVFISFYMSQIHHAPQNDRWFYCSLSLDGARQHLETLHGIVPYRIIVRVAPLLWPLGTFHQLLRRHRAIVTAKQNI
jgi:hypothetical protein